MTRDYSGLGDWLRLQMEETPMENDEIFDRDTTGPLSAAVLEKKSIQELIDLYNMHHELYSVLEQEEDRLAMDAYHDELMSRGVDPDKYPRPKSEGF